MGGALLFLAGGAMWWASQPGNTILDEDGRAPFREMSSTDLKSKRSAGPRNTRSPLALLPFSLRELVLETNRRALLMDEDGEITMEEIVGAEEWIKPQIDALELEYLRLLRAFYTGPERGFVSAKNRGPIGDSYLLKRWAQLDPEGLHTFMLGDIDRTLTTLTEPIEVTDAFVGDVDMDLGFEDYAYVFEGWATRDPMRALEAWQEIHDILEKHPAIADADRLNLKVLEGISSGWAEAAPKDAWRYLRENVSDLPYEWHSGFAWGLTEGSPWRDMAQEFCNSPDERLAILGPRITGRWACYEPEAAITWTMASHPQLLDAMFNSWYNRGVGGGAFSWLQRNHGSLSEEVRVSSLRSAVRLEWERMDDVLPILRTLPRSATSWEFLTEMAQPTDTSTSGYDVSDTLTPQQLRSVVEMLRPPNEVVQAIEAGLAAKENRESAR